MSAPGSRQAPDFDSRNPEELQEFLEEFEELAKRCRLIMREKAKIVVKYVDRETRRFWTRLEGYGDDYAKLKKKIMGAYSKNFLEDELAMTELIKLVKKSAKGTIENKEDLDTYYRKFRNIAADLVEEDIINKRQQDKYFWKELPQELRYAISDCLENQDPDFKDYEVLEAKVVMKAGHFVLRKAVARRRWGRTSKKGKRKESSDEESSEDKRLENEMIGVEAGSDLSDEESEEEVIGVEMDSDSDSEEEESITTTKTSLPLPPALKTKDVLKTKEVKDGVEREGGESWVDRMIGCEVGVASWPEEGQSEEAAVKTGGDVQCEEDAVMKKGNVAKAESGVDEAVSSGVGAVSWLVKERGAEVLTKGGGMRCDEDIISERSREGDRPRERKKWSGRLEGLTGKSGVDEAVWVADWPVEEREVTLKAGEGMRYDKGGVELERKGDRSMREEDCMRIRRCLERSKILGQLTEEGNIDGQERRGENHQRQRVDRLDNVMRTPSWKKRKKKKNEIRKHAKILKLQGKLTKKDKRQLLQGMDKVFSRGDRLQRQHHREQH